MKSIPYLLTVPLTAMYIWGVVKVIMFLIALGAVVTGIMLLMHIYAIKRMEKENFERDSMAE